MNNKEELQSILIKTVIFFLIALAGYSLLFFTAGGFLKEISKKLAGAKGLFSIFLYVYVVDTLIIPATPDIVFTVAQNIPAFILITIVSIASMAGGFTGYLIGRYLNHFAIIQKLTSYYKKRGNRLITRYGPWTVAIAGFTPVPYSTISWIAGMFKISPKFYLLASLTRIPRLALYYAAIREGINLLS